MTIQERCARVVAKAGIGASRRFNSAVPAVAGLSLIATLGAGLTAAPASADTPPPYIIQWSLGSGGTSGIAVDAGPGDVFVSVTPSNIIARYNSSGTLITSWGSGTLLAPNGLAVDPSSNVLVADNGNNLVRKFSNTGTLITSWAVSLPKGVAVDVPGNVYVVSGDAVFRYTTNGGFITTWGSTGSGNGQFSGPVGVATDLSGNVYVADTGNNRIQKFTNSGVYQAQWGTNGSGTGQFSSPRGVATDRYGHVLVADTGNNRVQAFSSTGVYLNQWGTLGSGNSQFNAPRTLATSQPGFVYVLDTGNSRVQEFGAVTTVTLNSSANPSVYFQPITLTATTSPPVGNGTMSLYEGATFLTSASIFGGSATFSPIFAVGSHPLTAQFAGDATHSGATSPVLTQTVNQASTTVALTSGVNPSGFGQEAKFTATVSAVPPGAGTPTGTVTFSEGATTLGTVTLVNRTATFSSTALAVGAHSITAQYDGNANYTPSSTGVTQNVLANTTPPAFVTLWGVFGTGAGMFTNPRGVALSQGNVYVVDRGNNRVQSFTGLGGTFNSQWGTAGSGNGQLLQPSGIAMDGFFFTYVTDTGNNRVQKFTTQGVYQAQWGTTGSGNGQFNAPSGIAVLGNVYVVDSGNHRIQRFNTSGGFVSLWGVFGIGNGQFQSPTGIAINSANGDVYVTDTGNNRVQRFNSTDTYLGQWGGSGSGNGQFQSPAGIAVDQIGNVYVADAGNNRIQKFSSTGAYLTQWGTSGTGPGEFQSPWGMVVNSAGTVVVSDQSNHRIQTFGTPTTTTVGSSINPSVYGQAVSFTANVTPANATGSVQFLDGATVLTIATLINGSASAQVSSMLAGNHSITAKYLGAGDYGGSTSAPLIQTVNQGTVSFALTTDPSPPGPGQPVTFTINLSAVPPGAGFPNGTVTVKDGASTLGTASLVLGSGSMIAPLATAGSHSITLEYSGDGNFQAATSAPFVVVVRPLDIASSFALQWGSFGTGVGQLSAPVDVAVTASRNVYVCDQVNNRILQFTPGGAFIAQWGTGLTFQSPKGVAVNGAGEVYVADTGNHRIQKFTSSGGPLVQWGTQGSDTGQFQSPADLVIDGSGYVYVCDTGNYRIQKFTGDGVYVSQWGTQGGGNGQLQSPGAIAVDGDGNLWVCDTGNHRVQEFTSGGTWLRKWGANGNGNGQMASPAGIAVELAGNVYVSDTGNNRIEKFSAGGTYLAQWGSAGSAAGQFGSPAGMAMDAYGYLVAADPGNHRVQKFRRPARITSVADIPGDQGKQVRVRFIADAVDLASSTIPITRYDVFRQIDPSMATAPARAVPAPPSNRSAPAAATATPTRAAVDGWDYVGSLYAFADSAYNLVVPTLVDSNSTGLHASHFFVRAATATPSVYFDAPPDSGWSVDNLPPAPPAPFTGAYTSGVTHLHWGRNTEPDLWHYRLYRDASPTFVPAPANLIASPADTGYSDPGPAGSTYKLSAVDVDGNESPYSTLTPGNTVDVPDVPAVEFGLEVASPARGGHLVAWCSLTSDAPATLELFDVTGRRIAGRQVSSLGPGRHSVDANDGRRLAPGLYLLRLRQGASVRVVRGVLVE